MWLSASSMTRLPIVHSIWGASWTITTAIYRYFVADYGDLDYFFIAGATLADVVRRYTWLTGRPAFLPKWSLGYSGSTMTYTDSPDAQQRLNEFLIRCEEYDILCDS